MPKSSILDPFLKIGWAKKHLELLKSELETFRNNEPIRVRKHGDVEDGLQFFKLEVKEVPDPIPLVVGDFLASARSSLDQLVWALAKLTIDYPERTQFPVLEKSPDTDMEAARSLERCTIGVPAEAISLIKDFQPYHAGNDPAVIHSHLIWQLHRLSIIDKHRRVPVNGTVSHLNIEGIPFEEKDRITFYDNDAMFSVPVELQNKMRFKPIGTIDIMFGNAHEAEGVIVSFVRLEQMHDLIANSVLPRFARFFK